MSDNSGPSYEAIKVSALQVVCIYLRTCKGNLRLAYTCAYACSHIFIHAGALDLLRLKTRRVYVTFLMRMKDNH